MPPIMATTAAGHHRPPSSYRLPDKRRRRRLFNRSRYRPGNTSGDDTGTGGQLRLDTFKLAIQGLIAHNPSGNAAHALSHVQAHQLRFRVNPEPEPVALRQAAEDDTPGPAPLTVNAVLGGTLFQLVPLGGKERAQAARQAGAVRFFKKIGDALWVSRAETNLAFKAW
jgi:hypothetical protein